MYIPHNFNHDFLGNRYRRLPMLRRALEEGTLAYHVHNALRQLSQATDLHTPKATATATVTNPCSCKRQGIEGSPHCIPRGST
jgi:hypothetical protein